MDKNTIVDSNNNLPGITNSLKRNVDSLRQKGDLEIILRSADFINFFSGQDRNGSNVVMYQKVSDVPNFPEGETTYYAYGMVHTTAKGDKKSLLYFSDLPFSSNEFEDTAYFFIDKFWEPPIFSRPSGLTLGRLGPAIAAGTGVAASTAIYLSGGDLGPSILDGVAMGLSVLSGELGLHVYDEAKAKKKLGILDRLYSSIDAAYILQNQVSQELKIVVQREVYKELLKESPDLDSETFLKVYQGVSPNAKNARMRELITHRVNSEKTPLPETFNDLVQSTRINLKYVSVPAHP